MFKLSNFQTSGCLQTFKLSNFMDIQTFKLSKFEKRRKAGKIEFESLKFEKYSVGQKYKKIESLKVWKFEVWKYL